MQPIEVRNKKHPHERQHGADWSWEKYHNSEGGALFSWVPLCNHCKQKILAVKGVFPIREHMRQCAEYLKHEREADLHPPRARDPVFYLFQGKSIDDFITANEFDFGGSITVEDVERALRDLAQYRMRREFEESLFFPMKKRKPLSLTGDV